jgi:hypothetical protein
MQTIFAAYAWSFRMMLGGQALACRHDGTPFTPYDVANRIPPATTIPHGALLQIRGDWEGMISCFRFRTPTHEEFCWACDATSGPGALNYEDFSEAASHRATMFSHAEYCRRCAEAQEQPSHIFRAPGTQLHHCIVDSMHAADLGSFADALGSLFFLVISNKKLYSTNAEGLAALNEAMNGFCKLNPKRRGCLQWLCLRLFLRTSAILF